jgi:hypothetical protein
MYRAQDVIVLPGCYDKYNKEIRRPGESFWQTQVQRATSDRIRLLQILHYDEREINKALGP